MLYKYIRTFAIYFIVYGHIRFHNGLAGITHGFIQHGLHITSEK